MEKDIQNKFSKLLTSLRNNQESVAKLDDFYRNYAANGEREGYKLSCNYKRI